MSFNILEGGMGYGVDRLEKILSLIETVAPDILVVCEANEFERAGHARLHQFERRLRMRGTLGLASTGFHVAVFARDADWYESVPLPGQHHAAVRVKLQISGRPLTVVGAHLCPFGAMNRLCEAEILANEAKPGQAVLLLGDLNALSPVDDAETSLAAMAVHRRVRHAPLAGPEATRIAGDSRALGLLVAAGFVDLAEFQGKTEVTYPTALRAEPGKPRLRIDYLLGTAEMVRRCRSFAVVTEGVAEMASDHYPVTAEFDWA